MLTALFERVLSMALTALPVMAVVLICRLGMKAAPKKYTYLLWLVVGFRLVCPIVLETSMGLLQPEEMERAVLDAVPALAAPETPDLSETGETVSPTTEYFVSAEGSNSIVDYAYRQHFPTVEADAGASPLRVLSVVWLAGMAVMLAYLVFSTLRLRRQVATAVLREDNVWECDGIPTPFVLGLFRPRIYIPFRMTAEERAYILAHERYHIAHFDHWAKLAGLLILAVYWWDPAVWLCWVLFCRDMEMRCDEAVLEELGDGVKREYSLSLISFALDRRAPMALAFGEHDAARRVKNVLRWKKAGPAVVFLAVAAVILVAVVCGTNAVSSPDSWIRLEEDRGVGKGKVFAYSISEDYNSVLLYQEVYVEGQLVQREMVDVFDFGEKMVETDRSVRVRAGELYLEVEKAEDWSTMHWGTFMSDPRAGGAVPKTYQVEPPVPGTRYNGIAWDYLGTNSDSGGKVALLEDSVLSVAVLTSSTEVYAFGVPADGSRPEAALRNEVAVVLRMKLSKLAADDHAALFRLQKDDAAWWFYDLRVETAADTDGVRRLLEALNVDAFGSYKLKLYEEPVKKAVIQFQEVPADGEALEQAMLVNCGLLIALVEDLEQVDYAYPSQEGSLRTFAEDGAQFAFWVEQMGYQDLKDLGRTAAGIRAYLEYMRWQPSAETEGSGPVTFASLLLTQDQAGTLLDAHQPVDLYYDERDWWRAETDQDTILCYVYYTLARQDYEMLLEGLETQPDYSYTYQTAGAADEVAQVAVTKRIPKGEVLPLRNAIEQRRREQEARAALAEAVPFTDILGYDGLLATEGSSFWHLWTYYAQENGETFPIAESFGFSDAPQDYSVDLDGDGVAELITNVQYGGDGAQRVYVFQRRPEGIYRGELSMEDLPNFESGGVVSYRSEYDPAAGLFRLQYAQKNTEEMGVLETRDLGRFEFSPYEPAA